MYDIFVRTDLNKLKNQIHFFQKHSIGAEIALTFNDIDRSTEEFDILKELKNFTFHAPFFDVNLVSRNSAVQKESIKILTKTIHISNLTKPKNIVIHHNYSPFVYNFDEDYYADIFSNNFKNILETKDGSYDISLENVFEYDSSIGLKIINKIDREDVGFCFDCGHFNLFKSIELDKWLDDWKTKIFELHIHNNYSQRDEHNPIPKGNIDIQHIIKNTSPLYYTIENLSIEDAEISLEILRDYLK